MNKETLRQIAERSKAHRNRTAYEDDLQEQIDRLEAEKLYREVEILTEQAAAEGLTSLVVAEIERDFDHEWELADRALETGRYRGDKYSYIYTLVKQKGGSEQILTGAAKLLFDRLKAEGFNPCLYYQHDGVGIKDWWEIKICWK